jgi:hypothetical protein
MASPKIKNNLSDFKSNFFGVVKPTLYEVVIMGNGYHNAINSINHGPSDIFQIPFNSRGMGTKLLTINCEVASLPGAAFSTQPNRIHGPVKEYPYERLYSGDLSLTFRLDHEMWLRKFFSAWQDLIYQNKPNQTNPVAGDFEYQDVYSGQIEIYQYPTKQKAENAEIPMRQEEDNDKPIYGIRMYDVYPKAIGPIELGYASVDTYSKQTIEFAYRNWEEIPSDEF